MRDWPCPLRVHTLKYNKTGYKICWSKEYKRELRKCELSQRWLFSMIAVAAASVELSFRNHQSEGNARVWFEG